jgi:hypothetical protein
LAARKQPKSRLLIKATLSRETWQATEVDHTVLNRDYDIPGKADVDRGSLHASQAIERLLTAQITLRTQGAMSGYGGAACG